MRYCIHKRSERQSCRLCRLRSKCCDDLVTRINLNEGYYRCEKCHKRCDCYEIVLEE